MYIVKVITAVLLLRVGHMVAWTAILTKAKQDFINKCKSWVTIKIGALNYPLKIYQQQMLTQRHFQHHGQLLGRMVSCRTNYPIKLQHNRWITNQITVEEVNQSLERSSMADHPFKALALLTSLTNLVVSSPDLIRCVYRFQCNPHMQYLKRSVLGLVLGLGLRLLTS